MRHRLVVAFSMLGLVAESAAAAQDRMPPIPAGKMTEARKKAAAEYKQLRGQNLTGPPWSVMLCVPDLVVPSLELRLHNRRNSLFNPKLTEHTILIAARHWTNNYEWNAYSNLAKNAGLGADIMAAVADGRRPERMSEDEAIVCDFCDELLHNQSVPDPTYARMVARFGEAGAVEAAGLEGCYTFLSMIMNTARSPMPAGAKPQLAPFPK